MVQITHVITSLGQFWCKLTTALKTGRWSIWKDNLVMDHNSIAPKCGKKFDSDNKKNQFKLLVLLWIVNSHEQ